MERRNRRQYYYLILLITTAIFHIYCVFTQQWVISIIVYIFYCIFVWKFMEWWNTWKTV